MKSGGQRHRLVVLHFHVVHCVYWHAYEEANMSLSLYCSTCTLVLPELGGHKFIGDISDRGSHNSVVLY